jgi:hypothetical protein
VCGRGLRHLPLAGTAAVMDRRALGWWPLFLDSLDTNGGHILILVIIMVTGFLGLRFEWSAMKSGELVTGAFGALLLMLRTVTSNREQQGGSTTLTSKLESSGQQSDPAVVPVVNVVPLEKP